LAQDEERERTGREARGRGGLGQTEMAMIEAAGARAYPETGIGKPLVRPMERRQRGNRMVENGELPTIRQGMSEWLGVQLPALPPHGQAIFRRHQPREPAPATL